MRTWGCLALLVVGAVGCGGGGGRPGGMDAALPDGGLPPLDATDAGMTGDTGTGRPGFTLPDPAPPGVTYHGRVVVSPAALTFTAAGDSAVLQATAFDAAGATVAGAVTWSSSRPAEVSVDAGGRVTSLTALGSAQITAKIGDRVSAPILVIVVEPQPDTIFVTDAQIVAGPEPVDATAPMEPDGQVRVSVTGVPTLQVGQLLVAKEGKPVAGRVVSIADTGASRAVVLQRIPVLDLFKKMNINAQHKVDEAALVAAEAAGTSMPAGQSALRIGPFECDLSVSPTAFGIAPRLRVVPNVDFDYALVKDMNDDWSLVSVLLSGSVSATGSATVAMMPGFAGTASCRGVLARIPLPIGGPLAAVLSFGVPLGLKGEIKATVSSTPLVAGLEVTSTGTVALGFTYTPQAGVQETRSADVTFKMKPKYDGPQSDLPFQVKLEGKLGPFAGLDVGVTLLSLFGAGAIGLLDAGYYAKLDADFSPPTTQFAQPANASKYEIKPVIELAPGKEAAKALKFFGGLLTLRPTVTIDLTDPHAQSPKGMMMASTDRASYGDIVDIKIKMDAGTLKFMGEDNLTQVYLYKQGPGGAPELLETFAARSGQTEFVHKWYPVIDDEGSNLFYAASDTFFAPAIPLEIAPESKVEVTVARRMNVWSGTVTMTIVTSDGKTTETGSTTSNESATENATIVLMLETTAGPIPEIPGPFKITSGSVSLSGNDTSITTSRIANNIGGCSYPVTVGTVSDTVAASALVFDDNTYGGTLATDLSTGQYALIVGSPPAQVMVTSVLTQSSQGGGQDCPDTGPPTSTTMFNEVQDIRGSQLTYMGTFDPATPDKISGEEMISVSAYPKYTRMTRWSFRRF